MKEINFLSNKDKRGNHKEKDKKEEKEKLEWSTPSKDKLIEEKEKPSSWFSFFKKEKQFNKKQFNKDKIKQSRKQILELIKENESNQNDKKMIKDKAKKGSPFSWLNKFKKSKDKERIVIEKGKEFKQDIVTKEKPVLASAATVTQAKKTQDNIDKKQEIKKDDFFQQAKKEAEKKSKGEEEKKWENPDILESNLIKGEITFFFDWRKGVIKLSIAIIIACLVIGSVYAGLIYWQQQQDEESQRIAERLSSLNEEIKLAEEGLDETLAFQNKLLLVSSLLDSHIYWTNFFKFLEENTLVDVYFQGGGFSGNTSGNYNFSAIGVNYNTIYQQIKALKKSEQVIKAQTTSGSFSVAETGGQSKVNFNIELVLRPELFYK